MEGATMLQWLLLTLFLRYICCKDLNPGNWGSCGDGQAPSPSQTYTTARVSELRSKMQQKNLGAYIIPSGNAHLSEFVAEYDKRRQYISGFTGSAGTAVVTMKNAALWTDGRYFLQAEAELGCDWILMREGEPGVPTIAEWIAKELDGAKPRSAGACPFFFGNDEWNSYKKALAGQLNVQFYAVQPDLIDVIWTKDRPAFPSTPINVLPLKYSGVSWQNKISAVQDEMEKHNVNVLIVTSLDETAWLFNMRATDIQGFVNDPFFYSVAIIRRDSQITRLYILDRLRKLTAEPTDPESHITVQDHLNTGTNGSCAGRMGHCVEVQEYNFGNILRQITIIGREANVKRVWISYHTNYAVYSSIPEEKVFVRNPPTAMMKARKNDVEVQGMKTAHIKDAVALARFMAKLEKEVRDGENWTEVTAMEELSRYRSEQNLSRGDSFTAISSVGPHAAINHYFATNKTDRPITTDETYLLDSGGQYLDGTTDVTRTFLFRAPTDFEKECYTRVLMGHINLAMAVWVKGKYGREIDAFARKPLWDVGFTFKHGTGHGIGHYLSVHEGPGRISNYHPLFVWDVPLEPHMFFSDEPGFYKDGEFGIRLENIVFVKRVETKYSFPGTTMLGMETVTFFPYEPHLIDVSIMTQEQLDWLNKYNEDVLMKIGPLLKDQGDEEAYGWVKRRTAPLRTTSGAACLRLQDSMFIPGLLFLYILFVNSL